MNFYPLASSSKGNAYLVTTDDAALLVDCGLSGREFHKRIAEALGADGARVLESLAGVLITHDHTDHIGGLKAFLKRYDVPVFANFLTAEATAAATGLALDVFTEFENGEEFEVGPFTVHPFSIPHDTPDPVGYTITAGGETYFHGTDIGTPLASIGRELRRATAATLESNHDIELLLKSGRAPSLIERIRGPRGHLSNDDACELVKEYASPRLKRLILAHLSHDCNLPELAEGEMRRTLREMGRGDIALEVAR